MRYDFFFKRIFPMRCPACDSDRTIKNGFNALNKQNYRCKQCGRQFVLMPDKEPISDETKDRIDRLLCERMSLARIARVAGVSESWLQRDVNKKYAEVPRAVHVKKNIVDRSSWNAMTCGLL